MKYYRLSSAQYRLFHSQHNRLRRIANRPGFFTSLGLHRDRQVNELKDYPFKTYEDTKDSLIPPTNIKMLLRDFIDDSLYNPQYGYYNRLNKDDPENNPPLLKYSQMDISNVIYSYAVAKYMVTEYKLNLYPHKDLIIYEMLGRNNHLVSHVLDYIQKYEPSIYKRTQYNVIQMSDHPTSLAPTSHHACLRVIDKNIFHWNTLVTEQCFFLGTETMSHFAHDVIRYDLRTMEPHQGYICIDDDYNYSEVYEPIGNDQLISKYSSIRNRIGPSEKYNKQMIQPARSYLYKLHQMMNYASVNQQYTYPEYIPTKLLEFLEILGTYFPGHRLIMTDYSSLPNTMEGINGPLVERVCHSMTTCAQQPSPGPFNILFPTNFDLLRDTYLLICRASKAGSEKKVKVVQYDDFLERYSDHDKPSKRTSVMYKLLHKNNIKMLFS